MQRTDFLIIGQGLAGTCLAWELLARGRSVRLVDRGEAMTASKISAGLLNPIIGRNLNLSWRFRKTFDAATAFYVAREKDLGVRFFHRRKLLRLFRDSRERDVFARKRNEGLYEGLLSDPQPEPLVCPQVCNELGGFEIDLCGSVDTRGFLAASRSHFEKLGCFVERDCGPGELTVAADGVRLGEFHASQAVLCKGFLGEDDPHFPWIPFRSAKGEILEVEIAKFDDERILNRGNWLIPVTAGHWRTGTTYAWEPLDTTPTSEARTVIVERLEALLPGVSWSLTAHHAAVRPIVHGRKPVLGRHPDYASLAIFNGLGSKGALHAPWCAAELAGHLIDGCPLDPELDLAVRFPVTG